MPRILLENYANVEGYDVDRVVYTSKYAEYSKENDTYYVDEGIVIAIRDGKILALVAMNAEYSDVYEIGSVDEFINKLKEATEDG